MESSLPLKWPDCVQANAFLSLEPLIQFWVSGSRM